MKKTKLTKQERDIIGRALCQIDKKIKYRKVRNFRDLCLQDSIYFVERGFMGYNYTRKDVKVGKTFLHKHLYVIVDGIKITEDNFEEQKYKIFVEEELDWEDIYDLVIKNWGWDDKIFSKEVTQ